MCCLIRLIPRYRGQSAWPGGCVWSCIRGGRPIRGPGGGSRSWILGDGTITNNVNERKLAAACNLVAVARDSGNIVDSYRRPRHYNRSLARVCFLASRGAIRDDSHSRYFYDRKRREGKSFKRALIALSRRRISVLGSYSRTAPSTLLPRGTCQGGQAIGSLKRSAESRHAYAEAATDLPPVVGVLIRPHKKARLTRISPLFTEVVCTRGKVRQGIAA